MYEKELAQDVCGNKLLAQLVSGITELINTYDTSESDCGPELLEELIEIEVLGDKLLTFNYFRESDALLSGLSVKDMTYDEVKKAYKKWDRLQALEAKVKQKDYNKFFKLIARNIDRWA